MRLIYLLMLLILCTSIFSFDFGFSPRSKMDIVTDKLIKRVGERLCEKHGMYMAGTGGGAPKGKLDHITVMLGRNGGPISKEQCREIMVDCIQTYLNEINSNEEIRPFLITYPYTFANVDITIINFYPDGKKVLDPNISTIGTNKKGITYAISATRLGPYKSEVIEPYEEALAKLHPQAIPKPDTQIITNFQN